MKTVVNFGELMMRLTPSGENPILHASSFDVHFGGSEYNVAAGLSSLGYRTRFITRLPDNSIGKRAYREILANGVRVADDIFSKSGRMGIYFLEIGASPRPNKVVYDRSGSSFALSYAKDFHWSEYFDGASWFHVSGITPALSDDLRKATSEAITVARKMNLRISFDINYRTKLWTAQEARYTLQPILEQCDVITTTEEDLERVFAIKGETPREIADKARAMFGAEMVAITLREMITVRRNRWGGCGICDTGFYQSSMYDIDIVDRVGAGDSFTAGIIAGMLDGNPEYAIELASAFSAIKQTIPGDVCTASKADAEALIKSGEAGRIQR
ncbi:MAG TPA: sugar kinase [Firmicutes bacterium]|nr:sugar kinase [Bacillota bacterium]